MSDEFFGVYFRAQTTTPDTISELITRTKDLGIETSKVEGTEQFDEYRSQNQTTTKTDGPYTISEVVDEVASSGAGRLTFWSGGKRFRLSMSLDTPDDQLVPNIYLSFSKFDLPAIGVETLINWVATISETLDIEYGFSGWDPEQAMFVDSVADELAGLRWLQVFGPRIVEDLGGRDHVLATPAWDVTELDSGHVLIVHDDHPFDPAETAPGNPSAHLLTKG